VSTVIQAHSKGKRVKKEVEKGIEENPEIGGIKGP